MGIENSALSLSRLQDFLESEQRDGLWSYLPGRGSAVEVSAWAALALRKRKPSVEAYLRRLLSEQNEDGGWSNESQRLGSDWSTAPALLSINLLSREANLSGLRVSARAIESACSAAEGWLMENRAEYYSAAAKFALLLWKGPESDYARGWSWTQNTFDWVEPTSYAIMALRSLQSKSLKREKILNLAEEYMLSLVCDKGGWNFGDRNPYSAETPPDIQSTALAIMALKNRQDHPLVRKSRDRLEAMCKQCGSLSAGIWLLAGLCFVGGERLHLQRKILESQKANGCLDTQNMLLQAVAAVFLDDDGIVGGGYF